mmetsp:Transcript_3914/g.10852  ORF Transcript_3914/g.10852 Transcript_3914/m.10852 type:complete len:297 (-) Transcript_3914:1068-1958(-)
MTFSRSKKDSSETWELSLLSLRYRFFVTFKWPSFCILRYRHAWFSFFRLSIICRTYSCSGLLLKSRPTANRYDPTTVCNERPREGLFSHSMLALSCTLNTTGSAPQTSLVRLSCTNTCRFFTMAWIFSGSLESIVKSWNSDDRMKPNSSSDANRFPSGTSPDDAPAASSLRIFAAFGCVRDACSSFCTRSLMVRSGFRATDKTSSNTGKSIPFITDKIWRTCGWRARRSSLTWALLFFSARIYSRINSRASPFCDKSWEFSAITDMHWMRAFCNWFTSSNSWRSLRSFSKESVKSK